jgi:predicted Rossmann fold nucleotide-binding protein DprA/Smf involved in DNA uptake
LEQIISQTEIKTDELMVVLTTLELKGLIQQTGVEQYTRTLN